MCTSRPLPKPSAVAKSEPRFLAQNNVAEYWSWRFCVLLMCFSCFLVHVHVHVCVCVLWVIQCRVLWFLWGFPRESIDSTIPRGCFGSGIQSLRPSDMNTTSSRTPLKNNQDVILPSQDECMYIPRLLQGCQVGFLGAKIQTRLEDSGVYIYTCISTKKVNQHKFESLEKVSHWGIYGCFQPSWYEGRIIIKNNKPNLILCFFLLGASGFPANLHWFIKKEKPWLI